MRFDFSNLCALRDTLSHLMERYEEDENAFRQFYDAVAEKTLCPHSIGPIRIYDGRDAVLEYIRWFYATTSSVSLDDCTDALYLRLEDKNSCSYGEQIDLPTICHVLTIVDDLFSFSQKLHPISISILDSEMDGCNGESTAIFADDGCSGTIFLYRMWNDFDGRFTPATVLLHELGHQLHFHLTGELRRLPKNFYDFLRQLGADDTNASDADMLEVFADTFLLAVIHKTKEFGDPFPEISEKNQGTLLFLYPQHSTDRIIHLPPCRNRHGFSYALTLANQLGFLHTIDQRRRVMNTKTVVVHCEYSEEGKDIADIIQESFRLFLQKELGTFAIATQDGVS